MTLTITPADITDDTHVAVLAAAEPYRLSTGGRSGYFLRAPLVRAVARAVGVEHHIERVGTGRNRMRIGMHYDADEHAAPRLAAALRLLWADGAARVSHVLHLSVWVDRGSMLGVPLPPPRPTLAARFLGIDISDEMWAWMVHAHYARDGALYLAPDEVIASLVEAGLAEPAGDIAYGEKLTQTMRDLIAVGLKAGQPVGTP
jgi:hypothetical protein